MADFKTIRLNKMVVRKAPGDLAWSFCLDGATDSGNPYAITEGSLVHCLDTMLERMLDEEENLRYGISSVLAMLDELR